MSSQPEEQPPSYQAPSFGEESPQNETSPKGNVIMEKEQMLEVLSGEEPPSPSSPPHEEEEEEYMFTGALDTIEEEHKGELEEQESPPQYKPQNLEDPPQPKQHHSSNSHEISGEENIQELNAKLDLYARRLNEEVDDDPTTTDKYPPEFASDVNEAILTITVEIGDGRQECIIVHESDNVETLAKEFCEKHNLNMKLQELLGMHIRENLEQVKDDERDVGVKTTIQEEGEDENIWQLEREARCREEAHNVVYAREYDNIMKKYNFDLEGYDCIRQKFEAKNTPIICDRSRKMVANKGLKGTVYNRLHNYARKKQIQKRSLEPASKRVVNNPPSGPKLVLLPKSSSTKVLRPSTSGEQQLTYGHRLYQRGMKKLEEKKRKCEAIKTKKVDSESRGLTFTPQINFSSRYGVIRDHERVEDFLFDFEKNRNLKLKEQVDLKSELEQKETKFAPSINKLSEKIVIERSRIISKNVQNPNELLNPNKFESLFEDAKRRLKEKEQKEESGLKDINYTFKPQKIATFNPNLYHNALSEKERKTDQEISEKTNIESEQKAFMPKINKRKPKDRTAEPIGDHLFKIQSEMDEARKAKVIGEEKKSKAMSKQAYKRPNKSNKMVEKMKIERFKEIFELLDSSQNGTISATSIDITSIQFTLWKTELAANEGLTTELLDLFTPLLCEMEDMKLSLNEKEFIESSSKLYQSLSLPEKDTLLNSKKKPKIQEGNYSFAPRLDSKSMKMAVKKRPPGENVEDILIRGKEEFRERMKEKYNKQKDGEMEGCTFQPALVDAYNAQVSVGNYESTLREEKSYIGQTKVLRPVETSQ